MTAIASPTFFLKLQIGPIQDFIAQARSTRDLWSGSYLLSWLMAVGLAEFDRQSEGKGKVFFPEISDQPIVTFHRGLLKGPVEAADFLTPNLPNLFVARMPAISKTKASEIARAVSDAIRAEWKAIADTCWRKAFDGGVVEAIDKTKYEGQVERHLSIAWQITPEPTDHNALLKQLPLSASLRERLAKSSDPAYAMHYLLNGWQLDAVRQTRCFEAWSTGQTTVGLKNNKDSLSGREERLLGGNGWWRKVGEPWDSLLMKKHPGDFVGAITLIKRVWHKFSLLPRIKGLLDQNASSKDFPINFPSTRHIASHDPSTDEQGTEKDEADDERYFAVLAFDGDQVGHWVGGEFMELSEASHQAFSRRLSHFALNYTRPIVEDCDGRLIYSGGDDVLALLPADKAVECAQKLRLAYREAMAETLGLDPYKKPDASVGIAMAHFKSPLQDVVRAAQAAEKRAKSALGRAAVAVSLFKRSGEILEWGCQWDSGGLALFEAVHAAMAEQILSAKFPQRVSELLAPYITRNVSLCNQGMQDAESFETVASEVILKDIQTALERQHGPKWIPGKGEDIREYAEAYLRAIQERWDKYEETTRLVTASDRHSDKGSKVKKAIHAKLESIIGLCQAVSFARRTITNKVNNY